MGKSRAATRTINILELVASKSKGITLSEIATQLDIPVTSVNDILKALLDQEMIEIIDERSKVYGIGIKAFYIGNAFIQNTTLIDKAKSVVEDLGNILNKTVFLGKEVHHKITYIYKYEPKNLLIATCPIGSRTSLHCTALGKCILAHNDELLESISKTPLLRKTKYTITDYNELYKEIQNVKIKGYAVDDREQNEYLLCIGAPIFDSNNSVIAALSISGLYNDNTNVQQEAEILMEKAAIISTKMGYVDNN
ncbi:IclR family transcriptional regulator [Vallitalea longa]|uniref:IclR family transcriptional regulator n=1 Tax=Vallitalea longa TaxID=2936439 RepID=A0A9W5YBF3_9FIRM|nr:IclR family transcriptional regulator [Vallitalea longa]GKX29411.1 IclR family transcriptional regulator [Vallitalea longa]